MSGNSILALSTFGNCFELNFRNFSFSLFSLMRKKEKTSITVKANPQSNFLNIDYVELFKLNSHKNLGILCTNTHLCWQNRKLQQRTHLESILL